MTVGCVALTGATGFLGRRLTTALEAAGWRVRVLVRPLAREIQWDEATPEVVVGDLGDAGALARLMEGADTVIHAAGLIKALARDAFFQTNVEGVRRVAAAAGGRPMILVSSLAAREPALSDYAASKRAGEDAARNVAGGALTVIRPPAIYGPGDRETLGLFRAMSRSPFMVLPGDRQARFALAHVDDVADIVVGGLRSQWLGETITIGGDRPGGYGWIELADVAARAVGRRTPVIGVSNAMIGAVGALSETIAHCRRTPAIFTRGKAREMRHHDWTVSRAERGPTTAWRFIALDEGFTETVAWYRKFGWLR